MLRQRALYDNTRQKVIPDNLKGVPLVEIGTMQHYAA